MIYNVTLNTVPLVGHPAGPFYIELAFTDGGGVNDANNTVSLSNFNFGGGSALGSPLVLGGASGSLETGISIVDKRLDPTHTQFVVDPSFKRPAPIDETRIACVAG